MWFPSPVELHFGGSTVHVVQSAHKAALFLLERWPQGSEGRGIAHRRASEALLAWVDGAGDPATASRAFRDDAHEAGILIER